MNVSGCPSLRVLAAVLWLSVWLSGLGAYTLGNLQTASDGTIETIPLEATVQDSPAQIRIKTYAPGTFTIYRKSPDVIDWGAAVATGVTLAGEGVWTDSTVSIGTLYEYRFVNTAGTKTNSIYPSGYILCGIEVDVTQPKGRMAVIVASDVLATLPSEFSQYKADLVADGWTVHEIPVPRAPNYSALGNGNILTLKLNAGGSGYVNSDYVTLTNASGKTARAKLAATNGVVTSATIPNGAGGTGFSVNETLTVSGGTSTGTGATLIARVDSSQLSLKDAAPLAGGSGYINGQAVTLTGAISGKKAQAGIYSPTFSTPSGTISWIFVSTSEDGFVLNERLIMTGNTTGSGVGTIIADAVDATGKLTEANIYTTGSGYIEGDPVTLTGGTSGKTAQALLHVNADGLILSMTVVSSQVGFIADEPIVISGASAGSGVGPFKAMVGGPLQSVQVVSGGSGYANGDVVGFDYATTSAQGVLNVTNGVITSINITSGGTGYTDGDYIYLTGLQTNSAGLSLSVNTVDNTGTGRKVIVSAGGSGYRDNDRVTITGATSGATATGSLIAPAGSITGVSVVLPATFSANESLTLAPASGGSGAVATASSALTNFHPLIRGAVQAINSAYPGELKNLSLIGKVPVARSGLGDGGGADGHGNVAPYGTDAFYADTDGVIGTDWTDVGYNDGSSATNNLPGDGQFDAIKISEVGPNGRVELGYGRIDLSHGIQTETEALRTYFWKLHRYKVASADFRPGRRVVDRWTYPNERETQLQSMPGVVGMNNVEFITNAMLPRVKAGQDADQLYTTQNGPYLFYFKGSGGPSGGVGGRAVFWTGMQSHWGYWYEATRITNGANLMQKSLSQDNFTLSYTWNIWGLRYIYHRLGMGFDAGDMTKQSINNRGWTLGATGGPYTYKFNNTDNGDYHGSLYMHHMGDPALRLFMFEPPTGLSVVKTAGNPVLTWTASPASQVIGYHVYRAANASAPFTRLTSAPVAGTTYTDTGVTTGSYVYMVRAVRLETTGGGTFYNASLGATQSVNLDVAPSAISITTNATLPAFNWNSAGSVTLAAQGGVPQYSWSLDSGALPAGLTLSGAGVISGTPTATGSFGFTAQITDQVGQTASRAFTLSVGYNSAAVVYPEATTYTDKAKATTSYGTDEAGYISGLTANMHETFQRYDLSGLALNNSFVRATLYLYVTSGTTTGAIANVQANLIADSLDGWIDRGISRPFTGVSNNGSGKTRIACPGHGFTSGTQISLAGLTGTGAPSNGPYAITVVNADTFDLLTVNFGSWTYDPALAFVSTTSMTYNTRPTTYNANVATITGTGVNTPGTLLQLDVTSFVRETLANDPLKKLSVRLFTATPQTVAVGSANAYGAARPYIVFETTNAPDIAVVSPLTSPACIYTGSNILLTTTVTPLPARAASLALQWSKVSGPGAVTFTNATSSMTGASFGAPGDYVLRLTANDGIDQSLRDIPVRVLSTPVSGPADSNLKLRLALDETSGTSAAESSGISPAANGTLVGNATWEPSGRIGGALSFNGSLGRVEVADSSTSANPLDGLGKMTISLWLKANSLPSGGSSYAGIITKRLGAFSKESYRVELRGGTGNSSIYVTITGGTSLVAATTVAAGQWYHLGVVFDGSLSTNNLKIYINGNPDKFGTITPTTVPRNNTSPLKVGSNDLYDFFGTLDEVRIYDRALTATEIQDLATAVPANIGPVVSAGAPLSGNTGELLSLAGSASDDGKPSGSLTLGWAKSGGPGNVTFGNAAAASTTGNFATAGNYTLLLTANDGVITTFAQTTAAITAAAGMDAWRMTYFGTTDATGNRADTASAANDGMANLLKYALGLNPNVPATAASAGLSLQVQTTNGANYLSYTFTGTASDVTYLVEATSDLSGSWTPLYTNSGSAPGTVTVVDTEPLSTLSKRFMRLRVTRP